MVGVVWRQLPASLSSLKVLTHMMNSRSRIANCHRRRPFIADGDRRLKIRRL